MIEPLILWSCVGLLALALLVSLICLWRVRRLGRALAASADWVPVEAAVIESRVEWHGAGEMGGGHFPVIAYDYTVDGQRFRSGTLTLGPQQSYSFQRSAARVVERYPVGSRVAAWIDPADPAQAVLDRRTPFRTVVVVMLAVLWIGTLGGIAILLLVPGVVGSGPALTV